MLDAAPPAPEPLAAPAAPPRPGPMRAWLGRAQARAVGVADWRVWVLAGLLGAATAVAVLGFVLAVEVVTSAAYGEGTRALEEKAPRLVATETLGEALARMTDLGLDGMPVVAAKGEAEIVGTVTQVRALRVYNRALVESHIEHHR